MYVGVDYHKRYLVATTMTESGQVVGQERVETEREALEGFVRKLVPGSRIAVEASGSWYAFYELLEGQPGVEVVLAHPLKTRAIADAKIKTDKIDATMLAHLLRTDLLPQAYIPPRQVRDQREVLRYRASLVSLRTGLKNKVHAILSKNGIQMPYSDIFGKKACAMLRGVEVRDCYRRELDGYLALAERLQDLIKQVSEEIAAQVEANPAATLLMSIPGISYYSALLIVSEIGEIGRFPSARKLCSYAGLVPSVHSSGGKTYHGSITKQGSRWLRWILIELAPLFVRGNRSLEQMHRRIQRKHGPHTARVAIARRMLQLIYYMLRDHKPFAQTGAGQLHVVMASA